MKLVLAVALVVLAVASAAGKGKKHRHQKPGRDVLDRLASTTISEVKVASGAGSGLVPAPLDVAPYAAVTANATCGEAGVEEFCRDTPGKRGVVCDVCEGIEGSSSRRHPPAFAVDGDPDTWWQSPTAAAGDQYTHVELVATLPDEMDLLHVIIKSGPSPRPLAWSLEVSSDISEDWRLVKAFGDKELCKRLWDLRPERRRRKARATRKSRADKPTCSTQFTSPRPLENGEMHVGLGEGVAARRVRVSFRAAHEAAPAHRYYTVRALTLAARCRCHGRAEHCLVDAMGATCSCAAGACGARCERCCGACGAGHLDRSPACEQHGADLLCVNCTDNRAGPLCDRCLFGYYSKIPDGPCFLCKCDAIGSEGSCTWTKRHGVTCKCNRGFTGHLCDACEDQSAVYPDCGVPETTPACKCDPRGIKDPNRICDEVCDCKEHVIGERCDTCAAGHYGLSGALPAGCRACYCSRLAATCEPDPEPGHDMILPLGDAWRVSDALMNETQEASIDNQGKPYVISYEVEGWESFYWLTEWWSGTQLSWYGGEIHVNMFWGVVRGDSGGNPTVGPDAILIAADGTMIAYRNTSHEEPGDLEIVVPIMEGEWYILDDQPPEPISKNQLMDVLADLKGLMLRAYFHLDQDEVRLESVECRGASAGVREVCACAGGSAGASCEACAWGHVRQPLAPRAPSVPTHQCVPCACNGHATCDTVDGACGPCHHNTTGARCERCLPGHYGNPVQGPCKPCACPLYEPSNNFSPNCALATAEGDEYVCTQCPDGYAGDHCEMCDFGYWGAPGTLGGACRACECGGAPCRRDTGACLACPAHAEGARCDVCQEGYWFGTTSEGDDDSGSIETAEGATCVACACGVGALAGACDARTGQCACRQGWTGRTCDTCAPGHGDVSAGCPACRCGAGALHVGCEPLEGACSCAPGAAPPRCDTCLAQHYNLTRDGCAGCNCSSLGAESNVCDIRTGQCRCRAHVTGRACDTCEEGYWGLREGGCRRCECGAGAAACDPVSGACACAPGVGGDNCDACLPGYYGFGPAGCLPCPRCTDGKVCSAVSGRCSCPAHARGPHCRDCAPGYWAATGAGCVQCDCGPGALTNTCDPHSGQCKCRAGWAGLSCDACAPGHYGSRCKSCNCVVAGTRDCQNGVCSCDEYGRCPCKANVVGEKCSQCREGTFGLSGDNPSGCTECFCFGRAAHCSQAGLTRAALRAPAPVHLTLLHAAAPSPVDQDSLLSIHTHATDATISMPWPPVPVYVELDKRFLGDRTTSYGGWLMFSVEEEGGEDLPEETRLKFPLVRLYGKDIVLEYYQRIPAMNGTHAVRLHESLWSVRGMAGAVSRGALMLALRKLDRAMLRVSTRTPVTNDPVHALLLNVTLDTAIPGISRTEPALGVEVCDCSPGYAAPSCQEPALGFWMPPQRVHVTSVAGTITIQLEGDSAPCYCNGRATACDPTTGHCLNCTDGTAGARCEKCEAGHYGAPDAAGGCQPCPCPSRARNFADACVLTNGRVQCLCKPGYMGSECSRCASGWYRAGGAGGMGGECVRCACHAWGALGPRCDARGRCRCRPHATGDKCDRCVATRTFMDAQGCTDCDNCSQTLLDSVENLQADMRRRADVTELSRIPQPFPVLEEYSHNASILNGYLQNAKRDLQLFRTLDDNVSSLEGKEHGIFTEANRIKIEAINNEKEALYLSLEGMSSLEEALKHRRKLGEKVEELNDFAQGERHLNAHRAVKEAKHLLRQIKNIRLGDFMTAANDVSTSANLQSTATQEYNYRIEDAYSRVRGLQNALEEWTNKSEDWSQLAARSWGAGDAAEAGVRGARGRLAAVRDAALRCRLLAQDISSITAHNITHDIISSIERTRNLSNNLPKLAAEVTDLIQATEEKEGIYYNLTPVYRQKYLQAVEKHVLELGKKAQEYKRLFAGTRATAASGVAAARAWADVADAVRDAAVAANAAVQTAATASKLAGGPAILRDTAMKAKNNSKKLMKDGTSVLKKAEELKIQLEHLRRNADQVSVVLRGLGWQERDLGLRPHAEVASTLATSSEKADRVFTTTRVLYDEASEVRRRVTYDLRRQLAELQRHGDTALGAAQEHVSQIRGNTERGAEVAEALAAAAAARARDHDVASAALRPSLEALKEKIARARHAAGSVSVSVTSPVGAGAGCARSYALPMTSPAVTRLALDLSFADTVRDGPLLYMEDDTQEPKRYIKLLVENKKLRLLWNLGADEGVINHPEELQPTVDDQHNAYKVEIDRVWNSVYLVVEGAGGGARVEARNSSGGAGGAGELRARRLWLAAPGAALPACVHALSADDARIGLWNFEYQPPEAKCSGCTQRGVSGSSGSGGEGSLARFGGAGYAELRRAGGAAARRVDRTQFAVSFTVRTRDEDALLFMALDQANNRSVVVRMHDCHIVFEVEYGGARLSIAARGRHCLGRPVHVQAIRVFAHNNLEKGSLRVNGEETLGSPSPPVQALQALPELAGARYWAGGAPPGGPRVAPPLLGCLGALVVNREAYDPLDTPARHGVEPYCVEKTLRSAMFSGAGGAHVELPWAGLRRAAALGLTFRALAPAGLLLLRAPHAHANDVDHDDHDHYLIVELLEGDLQVTAAAGKAELRLRTNGTKYDDKHLHTLRIVRAHKLLELWVDEEKVSSGVLAGNAIPSRPRGLFLGGAPLGAAPAAHPLTPSFTGTIADFIIDATLIGMETAVNWSGAQLGRAHAAPPPAPRAAPRAPHPHAAANECAKRGSYTVEGGAVKFGDAAHSRAALRLGARARHNLALRMHFRTYRDGLLLLAPGSKTKPKHFLALLIKEGKLKLILRGRKRKEVTLPTFVADGTWRSVSVRVSRGRAVLGCGGAAGSTRAPPLSRGTTLYIGGLPPPPALPNVPHSVSRVGGLVGCVRRVELGARAQDLVRAHHAVGQCFPNVQPAAYFGGDAYATYSSVWTSADGETESGIDIEIEFRTYEPNGVLLAYGGLLLEMKEGQVVLSWNGDAGSLSAGGEGGACDGAWHGVRARGPPGPALRLDAAPPARAPAALLAAPPPRPAPLYVAGLPESITDMPEGKENFKGCIKQVVINGQKKEWKEMESLHNVLLDSCPSP